MPFPGSAEAMIRTIVPGVRIAGSHGIRTPDARKAVIAMTATEEIQVHQERCQPYLLRLRMRARGEGELALTVAEVGQATSAVVAEAQAASRSALADVDGGYRGAGTFLGVRLDRLARVAEEAVAAAREGDTAGLRRRLYRFEAVTSAIWTAQDAVCGPASSADTHAGSGSSMRAQSR